MGREVRMVPPDWQHPKKQNGQHVPLLPGYEERAAKFMAKLHADGLQAAIDHYGCAPDRREYMPSWPKEQCTHYMIYEDTSEGTPISPAFATPEELAHWLADNNASAFGGTTATYEDWLDMIRSGIGSLGVMITVGPEGRDEKSGVALVAETYRERTAKAHEDT
jgi:hypothetical protein